jgi:hypothetical protein
LAEARILLDRVSVHSVILRILDQFCVRSIFSCATSIVHKPPTSATSIHESRSNCREQHHILLNRRMYSKGYSSRLCPRLGTTFDIFITLKHMKQQLAGKSCVIHPCPCPPQIGLHLSSTPLGQPPVPKLLTPPCHHADGL